MLSSCKSCCSCIPQRWIFTILSSLALCLGFVYSVFLSITIIEMAVQVVNSDEQDSGSCSISDNTNSTDKKSFDYPVQENALTERYQWNENKQGIILSSFYWSYTICRFAYGPVADRFGGKHVLGLGVLAQAVITFVTPLLIDWGGSTALVISRVLIGGANCGMYPAVSKMIPHWTTPGERTKIGNAIYSGAVLGIFFGNIIPVLVIQYTGMGWPAVFYFVGMLGMVWFPLWIVFVHEYPEEHPLVTEKELRFLQRSPEANCATNKLPPAPWKHIFWSKEFWAFTIIYAGSNWALYVMLTGLPRYMNNVVELSLESNGYISSLPYIFFWLNSIASAWIDDKIIERKWISVTNMRKIWGTITTMGPPIFLMLASYAECDKTMVVVMFMLGVTLFGNFLAGPMFNPMDLSPNYAASIMAMGEGIASVVSIVAPYAIGVLAPNSTLTEWRVVFWIGFFLAVVSNAVYLVWFKAEVQLWDDPNFVRNGTNCKREKEFEVELASRRSIAF